MPAGAAPLAAVPVLPEARAAVTATLATIAAAAAHAHEHLPLGPAGDEGLELFTVAPEVFAVADGEIQPSNPQ